MRLGIWSNSTQNICYGPFQIEYSTYSTPLWQSKIYNLTGMLRDILVHKLEKMSLQMHRGQRDFQRMEKLEGHVMSCSECDCFHLQESCVM
jgi:hypothetical protein